jgi:hypothetical protein
VAQMWIALFPAPRAFSWVLAVVPAEADMELGVWLVGWVSGDHLLKTYPSILLNSYNYSQVFE